MADIFSKIQARKIDHLLLFGKDASRVYLGDEEWAELHHKGYALVGYYQAPRGAERGFGTVMGLSIHRVREEHHLEVA